MSIRVILVSPGYPPMTGGGETYVQAIARELAERGLHVRVLATAAKETADFWRGCATVGRNADATDPVPVCRLGLRPMPLGRPGLLSWRAAMVTAARMPGPKVRLLSEMSRRIPAVVGLEEALEASRPVDVVHALNVSWEFPTIAAARWALRSHVPLIVTPFVHLGRGPHSRLARNTTMPHQVWALRQAAAVLTLGESERNGIVGLGVSADRVHTVGAGLDLVSVPDESASRETLHSLGVVAPYALMLGRVSRDKGAHRALRALAALRSSGHDVNLVLAGEVSPEMRVPLRHAARQFPGAVHILGRVDESAKWALLRMAACLVIPSEAESFGLVVLEAWHCATPVIGARAGGLADLIQHQVNGLLVPLDDVDALAHAILQIVSDPAGASALGEAGKATLSQHTWAAVAAKTHAIYDSVLWQWEPERCASSM